MERSGVAKLDYLDKMIEAYEAAIDAWDLRKGGDLGDSIKMMERAAMKAAWNAAQAHLCNNWSNMPPISFPEMMENAAVHHKDGDPLNNAPGNLEVVATPKEPFLKPGLYEVNGAGLADAVLADAMACGIGWAKVVDTSDGVALMSISHPPCAMFPSEEDEKRDRIWAAVKAASGGSY